MWWAASVAKQGQVIQDRWCAICRKMMMHLIGDVWVHSHVKPTQMAIPLHKECNFLNSWSLQCGVFEGSGHNELSRKTHLIGVDLES